MEVFSTEKILPAVTIEDCSKALDVATAIYAGGVSVMEITFRTSTAAESIASIRNNLPEMHIGAGTILNKEQLHRAQQAGAMFGLSPGFNRSVVEEAIRLNFPFIPGVMTPSDIELALELGFNILKLFPVAQLGGVDFLKALMGPYGHTKVRFIPMGGINLQNMSSYLYLKNVQSVGGSWLATEKLIEECDYEAIRLNTIEAKSIIKQVCNQL